MPKLDEIRYGRDIGKSNRSSNKYIWSACIDCGKERWVALKSNKPKNPRCMGCMLKQLSATRKSKRSHLAKGTAENPLVGDIRWGNEIGYKSHSWIFIECPTCSKKHWVPLHHGKPKSLYCHHCAGAYYHAGKKPGNWKNGRNVSKGYISIRIYPDNPYFPMARINGYVAEHRLVMAQYLGRCLKSSEIVHHINGKRDNNNVENLMLVTRKSHNLRYATGYKLGFQDGIQQVNKGLREEIQQQSAKINELQQETKLLHWQIKQLNKAVWQTADRTKSNEIEKGVWRGNYKEQRDGD